MARAAAAQVAWPLYQRRAGAGYARRVRVRKRALPGPYSQGVPLCTSRWKAACTPACPPLPHCTAEPLSSPLTGQQLRPLTDPHAHAGAEEAGVQQHAGGQPRLPHPEEGTYEHCRTLRRHCQALEHAAAVPPHSITASQPPGRGLSGPTRRLHSDQGASSAAPPQSHTAARQQARRPALTAYIPKAASLTARRRCACSAATQPRSITATFPPAAALAAPLDSAAHRQHARHLQPCTTARPRGSNGKCGGSALLMRSAASCQPSGAAKNSCAVPSI